MKYQINNKLIGDFEVDAEFEVVEENGEFYIETIYLSGVYDLSNALISSYLHSIKNKIINDLIITYKDEGHTITEVKEEYFDMSKTRYDGHYRYYYTR